MTSPAIPTSVIRTSLMRIVILAGVAAAMFAADVLVEGNKLSPVKVVIYEDLQCTDCAVLRKILDDELLPRFAGTVAFEHRDFPLEKHKWARKAAIVSRYFAKTSPQLAVDFRRWALRNLAEITPENFDSKLASFTRDHNASNEKALAALSDTSLVDAVETDYQDGIARGISRTPTVLINGQPFVEPSSGAEITKAIEKALASTKP